jgi:sugar-specific transcriptional regulator TrmB
LKLWAKEVQTLMEFGLTRSQAKVYLTLVRLGEDSKALTIFRFSNVARQDVYRILTELEQLGLVVKVIAQPMKFKAITLKTATSILLKRKKRIFSELELKAKELVENTSKRTANVVTRRVGDRFVLIRDFDAILHRAEDSIANSKQEIDHITPYRELASWLTYLSDPFSNALNRGVEIRWIMELLPNLEQLPEIIRNFVGHARFTLRIVPSNLEAKISILDKKEMNMAVFPESEIGEAALWSDNPCLVSMAAEYFETIWQRGIDVDLEKDA